MTVTWREANYRDSIVTIRHVDFVVYRIYKQASRIWAHCDRSPNYCICRAIYHGYTIAHAVQNIESSIPFVKGERLATDR
jgi:hypothetical protein